MALECSAEDVTSSFITHVCVDPPQPITQAVLQHSGPDTGFIYEGVQIKARVSLLPLNMSLFGYLYCSVLGKSNEVDNENGLLMNGTVQAWDRNTWRAI